MNEVEAHTKNRELRDGLEVVNRELAELREHSITKAEVQEIRNSYINRIEFVSEHGDFMPGETLDVTAADLDFAIRAIRKGFAIDVSNHPNGHRVERHHL